MSMLLPKTPSAFKTFPSACLSVTHLFNDTMPNNPEEANVTSLKGYLSDPALRLPCTFQPKPSLALNQVF